MRAPHGGESGRIPAGGVVAAALALDDDRQRRTPDHAATAHPRRQGRCGRTPTCEHGRWQLAGSDYKRKAAKWRCPTKECKPGSRWIKASRLHTLIPRDSDRWRKLYRGRAAVEREFGRLKHEWSLLPSACEAGPATRRPDDPRQARLRPRQGASRTALGVAVRSRTHAWSAVLHPALHSPLQGSASARPVGRPVSKECSGTNAELPMSAPSQRAAIGPVRLEPWPWPRSSPTGQGSRTAPCRRSQGS